MRKACSLFGAWEQQGLAQVSIVRLMPVSGFAVVSGPMAPPQAGGAQPGF